MRRFANFYIVLFLVDAALSLLDELLVATGSPSAMFSGVRYTIAYTVIALSLVMYACLGIDRRLPKRVLLPLTCYVFWGAVALWPLSGAVGREDLPLFAAVGQFVIMGVVMVLMRGRLLLPYALFERDFFSLRNTLGFTAVNLLLTPLVLIYGGLAIASYYLEEQTAGFLRISPVGIYMAERAYHQEAKEVRLAGMMHIGKEDYYKDVAATMKRGGTIILAEGVTDRDRLLQHSLDYSELAKVIGLSSQERMPLDGNLVDLEDLSRKAEGREGEPDIARADIDLNRFNPQTIEFLNVLGRTLFSSKPLAEAFADYNVWAQQNMTAERVAGIMADILDKRNEALIESMVRTLERYDTIIIPWGAMHMPAIEAAVLAHGFEPGAKQERLSIDFRILPYAALWQKWSRRAQVGLQEASSR